MPNLVSIIIRIKNEERWLSRCLKAIKTQRFKKFEIIIVNNNSNDATKILAKKFNAKIVNIKNYKPGYAINKGIERSKGSIIVLISCHCIPVNEFWLENLIKKFQNKKIGAIYGRQLPLNFSKNSDKRDLFITFGLDPRIQKKDHFFHNANSAIRKSIWDKKKFDNNVTNIEDRIWASQILKEGHWIYYEPKAAVFHYHGIHQDNASERLDSTIKVVENLNLKNKEIFAGKLEVQGNKILAIIPVRKITLYNKKILIKTINDCKKSKYISDIFVLTSDKNIRKIAIKNGALVPFLRNKKKETLNISLNDVYFELIKKLDSKKIFYDLFVSIEPNFELRPNNLIDNCIEKIIHEGYDSIMTCYKEYNWIFHEKKRIRIDQDNSGIAKKSPYLITSKGLCFVFYPDQIRKKNILGQNPGFINVDKKYTYEKKLNNKFN
jgi:rhamnosyltransferase